MRRFYRAASVALLFFAITGLASAQNLYNERALRALGLSSDEIEEVMAVVSDTTAATRRLQADLEVKKAELARILLDDSPAMRQIERNLRETASVEVDIRLLEIERELAVRRIVGQDRWSAIIQALRTRRADAEQAAEIRINAAREDLARLQQEIVAGQRAIMEALDSEDSEERVREELRQIQARFLELRDALQGRPRE